jgi:hypothetical protein
MSTNLVYFSSPQTVAQPQETFLLDHADLIHRLDQSILCHNTSLFISCVLRIEELCVPLIQTPFHLKKRIDYLNLLYHYFQQAVWLPSEIQTTTKAKMAGLENGIRTDIQTAPFLGSSMFSLVYECLEMAAKYDLLTIKLDCTEALRPFFELQMEQAIENDLALETIGKYLNIAEHHRLSVLKTWCENGLIDKFSLSNNQVVLQPTTFNKICALANRFNLPKVKQYLSHV